MGNERKNIPYEENLPEWFKIITEILKKEKQEKDPISKSQQSTQDS